MVEELQKVSAFSFARALGGLLLVPENLHHAHRFEELARLVANGSATGTTLVNRTRLRRIVDEVAGAWSGHLDDPWPNVPVENFVFHGGNHMIIPGGEDISYILRTWAKTLDTSKLRVRNRLVSIIQFAAALSQKVLRNAGWSVNHTPPDFSGIVVPPKKRLSQLQDAVTLSEAEFQAIVVSTFIEPEDSELFLSKDAKRSRVAPVMRQSNSLVVVAPHLLALTAVEAVVSVLRRLEIQNEVADEYHLVNMILLGDRFSALGMRELFVNKRHLRGVQGAIVTHSAYAFDRDRCHHVMLVSDALGGESELTWELEDLTAELAAVQEALPDFLRAGGVELEFTSLVVVAGAGRDFAISHDARRSTLFAAGDLETIGYGDRPDPLCLWKFQRSRDDEAVRAFSSLDLYSAWAANGRRYNDDIKTRPSMIHIGCDMSAFLREKAAKKRTWKALPSWDPTRVIEVGAAHGPERPVFMPRGSTPRDEILSFAVETSGPVVWLRCSNDHSDYESTSPIEVVRTSAYWVSEFALAAKDHLKGIEAVVLVEIDIVPEDNLTGAGYAIASSDEAVSVHISATFAAQYDETNRLEREYARELFQALLDSIDFVDSNALATLIMEEVAPIGPKRVMHGIDLAVNPAFISAPTFGLRRYQQDFDVYRLRREIVRNEPARTLTGDDAKDWLLKVVSDLFDRLRDLVRALSYPDSLHTLLLRHEALVYDLAERDLTFASRLACAERFTSVRTDLEEEMTRHTSAAGPTRFLVELVAAEPSEGEALLSTAQFDELLAIASEIVHLGMAADVQHYELAPVSVAIGASGFDIDLGSYDFAIRRSRDLNISVLFGREESRITVPRSASTPDDNEGIPEPLAALSRGLADEMGFDLLEVKTFFAEAMFVGIRDKKPLVVIAQSDFVHEMSVALEWKPNRVLQFLGHFSLEPRASFLDPPKPFTKEDVYPWRFNRGFSYVRRPFVKTRENEVCYSVGHLKQAETNFMMLLPTARFKACSPLLIDAMGAWSSLPAKQFEEDVALAFERKSLPVKRNVRKFGARWIQRSKAQTLGDIDVLVIDAGRKQLLALECKNIQQDRMPHEIASELDSLFIGEKSSHSIHSERVAWLRANLTHVLTSLDITDLDGWQVVGAIVTNLPLVSSYLGKSKLPVLTLTEIENDSVVISSTETSLSR